MRLAGLEPACLTTADFKSAEYTISPQSQLTGTRYRIRTGVNAVKGHYPGPLDEPSMFLVETAGVEPTVPLRRKIYSLLGLPIFLHLQNI